MHPAPKFAWQDRDEILAFIAEVAFCTIFVGAGDRPFVVHAPVVVGGPEHLLFHVSRANRAADSLDGALALLSCLGPDAYVSPDWYGVPDQVPTWNYLAVEAEGELRRLSDEELVAQLEALSASQEARLAPKPPWNRHKMTPGRFDAMTGAIIGFEMKIDALRGTRKLGQNKQAEIVARAAVGMESAGRPDMAALMRSESDAE